MHIKVGRNNKIAKNGILPFWIIRLGSLFGNRLIVQRVTFSEERTGVQFYGLTSN